MTTAAAIYVRVSSKGQEEEGTSLGTQEQHCRAYAAAHGYAVPADHVYRDVHSGTFLHERPGLVALREAVRRREIAAVVIYALDRLSRSQAHHYIIADELERAGARLECVTEPIEDSAVGRFVRSARSFMAEVEREKIPGRTRLGRIARAEAGKPIPGPRPPYGYRWVDGDPSPVTGKRAPKVRLEPDPLTAPVVRRIFADVAAGIPGTRVAKALTAEGVPTPTGKAEWGQTTVCHIFKTEAYAAGPVAFRHGRTAAPIPLPAAAVPLVTADLAARVRAKLATNKQFPQARPRTAPEAHLLRGGHVRCAGCGCAMQASHRPTGPVYTCRTRYGRAGACPVWSVPAGALDAAVWARIHAVLTDRDELARALAALRRDDPTADDLAGLERRLAEVQRQRRNLVTRLAELDDDADLVAMVQERLAALGTQARALEGERAAVAARQAAWAAAQARLAGLEAWCGAVAAELRTFDYADKRWALERLGVTVTVERLSTGNRRGPGRTRWTLTGELGGQGMVGGDTSSTCSSARTRTPSRSSPSSRRHGKDSVPRTSSSGPTASDW